MDILIKIFVDIFPWVLAAVAGLLLFFNQETVKEIEIEIKLFKSKAINMRSQIELRDQRIKVLELKLEKEKLKSCIPDLNVEPIIITHGMILLKRRDAVPLDLIHNKRNMFTDARKKFLQSIVPYIKEEIVTRPDGVEILEQSLYLKKLEV